MQCWTGELRAEGLFPDIHTRGVHRFLPHQHSFAYTPGPLSSQSHTDSYHSTPHCWHGQQSPATILPPQPWDPSASLTTAPSWIEQTPSGWNFRPLFAPSTRATQKIAEHLIKQNIVSSSFQITNRRSMNLLPYLLK